jgi:hypothetical protein
MRIYYLNHENILHEYAYSSKNRIGWHWGSLHQLKIFLLPTSSITAVWDRGLRGEEIHVFYQGRCHDPLRI